MNTLYKALQAGLILNLTLTKGGVIIFTPKKPHGMKYDWETFCKKILPALTSKLQQINTLESQA